MIETQEKKQRALLIGADYGKYDAEVSLDELEELAETAGAEVVGKMLQKLPTVNNATYIGKGKLQEVKEFISLHEIDLLVVDDELSGAQIRNIEEYTGVDVIDRTMLILDIFAQRARSNEGKLQVELAQQKYLLPRLLGMGKVLSRLGGGIGTRGPGETKLESDRRHIRRRIESLEQELRGLEERRARMRERRQKNDLLTVAIVGYTNVGKSTLLNLLTDAGVLAKNQLFATLDPTAREISLPDGQTAILVDTVGLLRRLPHQLIQAFKSTLEEAANADLILNVCDISSDTVDEQLEVTQDLLNELGCGEIPTITVYNKADLLSKDLEQPRNPRAVLISAKENRGVDQLLEMMAEVLSSSICRLTLCIPYAEGPLLDRIRRQGKIFSEEYLPEGVRVDANVDHKMLHLVETYRCN
mgnify:CR=1 FL=1